MSEQPKFAQNKAELSRILDISRVTLDAWLKLPDRPQSTSNGKFVVAEWRVFAANRKVDSAAEESAALKLQKLRDEVARGQVELMKSANELVPVEWSKQLFAHLAISVRNAIKEVGLPEACRLLLYEKIEKINADDYLSQLRRQTVDAVGEESEYDLPVAISESTTAA